VEKCGVIWIRNGLKVAGVVKGFGLRSSVFRLAISFGVHSLSLHSHPPEGRRLELICFAAISGQAIIATPRKPILPSARSWGLRSGRPAMTQNSVALNHTIVSTTQSVKSENHGLTINIRTEVRIAAAEMLKSTATVNAALKISNRPSAFCSS
jgi:hypothetical protein